MSKDMDTFRDKLAWDSYFVDRIYESIREEVEFVADQYEEDMGREISEDIDDIIEEIADNGLSSLTDNKDNN